MNFNNNENIVDNVGKICGEKSIPLDKFYKLLTKQCDISWKDMYTILTFLNDYKI